MPEIRSHSRLEEILNRIDEIDDALGHDFGWAEVHGEVTACYALTVEGTANGDRAAEIFQEGIELGWKAMEVCEHIYYYEIGDMALYFLGPIDGTLVNLEAILAKSEAELLTLEKKPKSKKKVKCSHCGK